MINPKKIPRNLVKIFTSWRQKQQNLSGFSIALEQVGTTSGKSKAFREKTTPRKTQNYSIGVFHTLDNGFIPLWHFGVKKFLLETFILVCSVLVERLCSWRWQTGLAQETCIVTLTVRFHVSDLELMQLYSQCTTEMVRSQHGLCVLHGNP